MGCVRRAAASLGIVVAAWAFLAPAVHASENETFGITAFPERVGGVIRRTFAIPLDRGAVYEDAVRVYNRTDRPVNLWIYASDARAAIDGTISVALRGSPVAGLASWITLDRSSAALAPREAVVVHFRVHVRSANPSPDLAAIVAENAAASSRPGLSRRLDVIVRTAPPGSTTTSTQIRTFTLRSGWTIVAVGVLIAAGALVWLARRRGRRSREDVEPAAKGARDDDTPDASRPVLHRFGRADTDPKLVALDAEPAAERRRPPRRRAIERDDRPLLDEVAFIEDELDEEDEDFEDEQTDEVELPGPRTVRRPSKPAPRKPATKKSPPDKLDYIPLDDL
jgi:hypothetical protein